MKIVILPRTHELNQWADLLAALSQQYPSGDIAPEIVNDHPRMVLSVDDHEMSHKDRQFLESISRPAIGPQGSGISDEVYKEMRSRRWLMDSWYGLNNSIHDKK
jgi:hypothetical protein